MAKMKLTQKYFFTVDGETEQWYLEWLESQINNEIAAKYKVDLDCKIQAPQKRAKSLIITGNEKTVITHICDCESNEEVHTKHFQDTLDAMKKSELLGKQIKYQLGYSNFTFELWMILHKIDCNSCLTHRRNYLEHINRAFKEDFENLDQYKHEDNFKRVLNKIALSDVRNAIIRSKGIMRRNQENGYTFHQYKGYKYYKENPSLAIWEAIESIFYVCELL
jgi:excinuclease UvrABC ATPase subunit